MLIGPQSDLLIVPYGIETPADVQRGPCISLLIVPYGIETATTTKAVIGVVRLLIVPYGIETSIGL